MDNLRAFEDADYGSAGEDEAAIEAPPEIGTDERRMHVRAYNYWVSLLDGRPYPSIHDLEPNTLDDFGPQSVLLDFTDGTDDPKISWLGSALRYECDLDKDVRRISDVPTRSLLSRLTDHYLQIIANSAPIGFEAEFTSQRGHATMYRGILMPFSSDGDTIDFIFGVINWKEIADSATAATISRDAARALAAAPPTLGASPIWADGPLADPLGSVDPTAQFADTSGWDQPGAELPEDACLGDRLTVARDSAEAARGADARSRAALYLALGQAYDFALAAEAEPEDYAEILEDAGLKAQARAPMTPVVKLVFGASYDKTRLTEFAAALAWGRRQDLPLGAMRDYIEGHTGGLKAVVQAERRARRPEPKPDAGDALREALRAASPLGSILLDEAIADEFVLMVARRDASGRYSIIGDAVRDPALVERALRKAA